jgi:DNA invertase Pin-like site-specific DNA recombinase
MSGKKKKDADPGKAVAYLRVSTDRQDLSPDAQREAIVRWAEAAGVEVVATHEDLGVSGGTDLDKRPGLLAAIDALGVHGAGVLVVAKRDRLARDVLTAALVERLCERAGSRVTSADGTGNGDTPEAQLMRNMVSAFAMYERSIIKSRTKAALAVKRARGERVGTIPYGYRLAADGRHVEEHPEEQATVVRAREIRAQDASLRAVGRQLLEEGHRPRSGGAFHVQVLARMVAN